MTFTGDDFGTVAGSCLNNVRWELIYEVKFTIYDGGWELLDVPAYFRVQLVDMFDWLGLKLSINTPHSRGIWRKR